jgi:hypothetical protein
MQGHDEGLAQMRQGLAAVLATGQTLSRPLCLVLLAEAAGHAGEVEEGLRLLAEAMTAFEASGRGDMLMEAYRLQGEFLLRQATPDAPRVEACFQQALAVARRQQAKSWELRAAMSLARLWQQQDRRAAARDLLAPIYGWFTEGFDTADHNGLGSPSACPSALAPMVQDVDLIGERYPRGFQLGNSYSNTPRGHIPCWVMFCVQEEKSWIMPASGEDEVM